MKKLSGYARLANYAFWNRIAAATYVSESSLGIFRWLFGFFILLFNFPVFKSIANVPDALYNPPLLSLANLLNGFPGIAFFVVLDFLIAMSVFCFTVGIRAKFFGLLLAILLFVGNSFRYSFGKIDHGILHLVLLVCISLSGAGHYNALIPDPRPSSRAAKRSLAVLAVFIVFGMFTAGFEKALHWVDFDFSTSGFLSWFYPGYFEKGRTSFLAPLVLTLPKWIFEFVDYTAVIFELSGFILLLRSRICWLSWLLVACLFHLANTLLLNISFIIHVSVYLVFIDFSFFSQQVASFFSGSVLSKLKYFLAGFAGVVCLARVLLKFDLPHLSFLIKHDRLQVSVVLWTFAAIVISLELLLTVLNNKSARQLTRSL